MKRMTEVEIMENWDSKYGKLPVVSIKCLTYNHENYIKDAIDSFLCQKTTFPFEIVVHDDASTDATANIITQYQKEYPKIINAVMEKENQYSKGGDVLEKIVNSNLRGRYIAICEGDDYWTDDNKMQYQFEMMERHPDIDICAHCVRKINANSGRVLGYIAPRNQDMVIPIESVIEGGGGFVGTNSLFYRKRILENIPAFRKVLPIDYSLQVHGAMRGGMLYLSKCMSDYRFMVKNSWSANYDNEDVVNKMDIRWKKMTAQLDLDTDGKYHQIIERYMNLREIDKLLRFKHYDEIKMYRSYIFKLDGKRKYIYLIKTLFPKLYCILKSFRDKIRGWHE